MKILFVHNGSDLYGASRSLLRLSARLTRDGNVVKAVLPRNGPLRHELESRGVAVVVQPEMSAITRKEFQTLLGVLMFIFRFPFSAYELWTIVRQFRPDLIHSNTALVVTGGVVSKLTSTPHVWHIREFFSEFASFWRLYQWFILWFSTEIICVSEQVADQFHKSIRARVVVIHNGIPAEEMTPDNGSVDEFRRKYELNSCLTAGVIGRIKVGRKGQDVFVKAAALIRNRCPNARFICIGSPFPGNEEHLQILVNLVKKYDLDSQFVYTGDVEDMRAAYGALDVVVLPSVLPEPFGGVVLEAMAMGKPVVGTRIGGTIEQIEDGITGIFVKPGDEVSLAEGMERLLSDPNLRQRLGESGRQRFTKEFEFGPFYRKMLAIYDRLDSKSGRKQVDAAVFR